jgi:hypothetical protein
MATVFWDRKEVLIVKFTQQGTTITSEVHCKTPKILGRLIQNKRRGILTSSIEHLHDNAQLHTATSTWALLEHFNWELFDQPLFTYLKNWLGSQRFNNSEELMEGVKMWLSSQAADFFDTGIQKLIP